MTLESAGSTEDIVFCFSEFSVWRWALISRLVLTMCNHNFKLGFFSLVVSQNVVAWLPLWKFYFWRRDFQKKPCCFVDAWAKCLSDCSKLFHSLPSYAIDLSWNSGQKSLCAMLKYRSLDLDEISPRPMLPWLYIKLMPTSEKARLLCRESGASFCTFEHSYRFAFYCGIFEAKVLLAIVRCTKQSPYR